MMRAERRSRPQRSLVFGLASALGIGLFAAAPAATQNGANPYGEWRYQSADASGTRYSPVNQINASNFGDLAVAWQWRGDNFGDHPDPVMRSTPSYINGKLFTVAGYRRTVVRIDPATGETLWTYREPHTTRHERSMRANYGKGVAHAIIDGREVLYVVTPGFFLHAIDAETGRPLEGFGRKVPINGFPETGVVDLVSDLISDWDPWLQSGRTYDADHGIPRELGYITNSSPPIVVNGVVIVGNSAEQGYNQTRIENVPGDILAYDAKTGEFLWKFHVIPRPGEFGHDTWENDAWKTTGDVSSWAPMSADYERGIVYIPTNPPTIDYYGGFRPGAGLFGTSLIALDVRTGQRKWHFQMVHHDIWNHDISGAPVLANLQVDGRQIPAVIQPNKIGAYYAFNRETGEPVWPIVERPVPASEVPGEKLFPTQPHPTKPMPVEKWGITEEDLIDFTPELRQQALEVFREHRVGGPFTPPLHVGHNAGHKGNVACFGGTNIPNPVSFDPTTNILYASSSQNCSARFVSPGREADVPDDPMTTGTTISDWVQGPSARLALPNGIPVHKGPYSRITAIDMDTGEHLWWVPFGQTPAAIRNHPALQGRDLPNMGGGSPAITMVMGDLLVATSGSDPVLRAMDKRTGQEVANVELPRPGQYGMMTYLHEGKQYIVVQVGSDGQPGGFVTLALP